MRRKHEGNDALAPGVLVEPRTPEITKFSPQALWDETARYGGQRGPRLLRRFSTNKNHTGVSGDYYFVTKLRMNLFFGKKVHRLTVEEPSKGGRTLNKDIAFMNA